MKRTTYLFFLMCFALVLGTNSCQKDYLFEEDPGEVILKKGGKPADVEQGDLYGDLIEVERDVRGVPKLYDLDYAVEYQDEMVTGTIDVLNPRLDGTFKLYILDKYIATVQSSDPPDDEEPGEGTTEVNIEVNSDGFITNYPPAALYDGEGELLATVAAHVFPVEEGRLNLVRSPRSVIASRMTEVIKNFGNGTVADVVRDYCGRFYMVRTQGALDTMGLEDKPIDSPLENLALYYELMNYGFSRAADENGLKFLIEADAGQPGFRFQSRLDNDWAGGAKEFGTLGNSEQQQFVANLAAACVAAASDKSNFLTFDEIAYLNQFMGVPFVDDFDSSIPNQPTTCFFPTVCQPVRMINKTDKTMYYKYRYYVNYSGFVYNRTKFEDTFLDLCTIKTEGDSIYKDTIMFDIPLDKILSGGFTGIVFDGYRYTETKDIRNNAIGFANQADDYVQALEVVHNNEEFLPWQMPTPTWRNANGIDRNVDSPFNILIEESHGNKPPGKGDDETATTTPGKGRRGGR